MSFPVSRVYLSSDCFWTCSGHALTTEREEVMGLLLGNWEKSDGTTVARIWGISVLTRSDKRKDRVEIEPAQLAAAASEAEELSKTLGRETCVVGWYHSHPHITVHPSHVDVRTQSLYQMMDGGFVGLIFSCFNHDERSMNGKIQAIAFQSWDPSKSGGSGSHEQINIPLYVCAEHTSIPNVLDKLVRLQHILFAEEKASYEESLVCVEGAAPHPLTTTHSAAVYQKALCRLLEYSSAPLLESLEDRLATNLELIALLEQERDRLLSL